MKKTKTFLKKDNACFNSPCLNGATCTSTNGNFVCTCAQFYSGCLNGAICTATGTGSTYTCACTSGYSGINCQTCSYN